MCDVCSVRDVIKKTKLVFFVFQMEVTYQEDEGSSVKKTFQNSSRLMNVFEKE